MESESSPERFFVDPSILFSDAGLQWLEEDRSAREVIVVSGSFVRDLRQRSNRLSSIFVPQDDIQQIAENRDRLLSLLEGVATFDFEEVKLDDEEAQVLNNLTSLEDSEAMPLADEWAYLQSQSWGLSRARAVLDAFGRAGGVIALHGRQARDEAIQVAVPEHRIPARITPAFLARVGVKWLLLGGAAGVGSVLSGAIASALIGPVGLAAGAGGAYYAGQVARVTLRALDA